jgi:hypothetical protein
VKRARLALILLVCAALRAQEPIAGPGLASAAASTGGTCASLGGDVTGTCAANTAVKVNGASVAASQVYVGTNSAGQIVAAPAPLNYGDFGASFTGNGSALASGAIAYGTLTVGCTIAAWNISASPADTATFDIWILGSPTTAIATVSNTVTASALPAISTGTYIHSTTLTSWTTTVAAGSSYAIKLTAVGGTATYANLKVQCR